MCAQFIFPVFINDLHMWCASFLFTAHDGACSRGNQRLTDSAQAMLGSSLQRHALKTQMESKGSFHHPATRSGPAAGLKPLHNFRHPTRL